MECRDIDLIVLPDDPVKVEQLKRKLQEYRNRLKKKLSPATRQNTKNKVAIVERLLKEGIINFNEILTIRRKDKKFISEYNLRDAFIVINCYVLHNGAHVYDGTGLPAVKA